MKFRWTMKQMETMTDAQILRGLIAERKSDLNPYAPLARRLQAISNVLDRQIETEREAEKKTGTREILETLIRSYEKWNQRKEGGEDDLHYAVSQAKTLLTGTIAHQKYLEEAADTLHYLETILSEESEEVWEMELGRIRMTLAKVEGGNTK